MNSVAERRQMTPLWIIALFLSLTETVCGVAVTQTTGLVQSVLAAFVIVFPVLVAAAFFALLWVKPWQLYAPTDFSNIKVDTFVKALRGVVHTQGRIERKIDSFQEEQRLARQLLNTKSDDLWKRQLNVAMAVHGGMVRFAYAAQKPESEHQLCEAMGKYLADSAHMNLLLPKGICEAIAAVSSAAMKLVDSFVATGSVPTEMIAALTTSIREYENAVRRSLSLDAIDKNTGLSALHVEAVGTERDHT